MKQFTLMLVGMVVLIVVAVALGWMVNTWQYWVIIAPACFGWGWYCADKF